MLKNVLAMAVGASLVGLVHMQGMAAAMPLPLTWLDKDTGHRVWRLSDMDRSSTPYFNVNAFAQDGRTLVYSAPDGIHCVDVVTRDTRLLVPNEGEPDSVQLIAVGNRTGKVYFVGRGEGTRQMAVFAADIPTGTVRQLASLPPGVHIDTVNADETLVAGTRIDTAAQARKPGARRAPPMPRLTTSASPKARYDAYQRRYEAKVPLVMFAMDVRTGATTELLHSTDWPHHLQFSPKDPQLLMYAHEGPWHLVDRIWTIRTDGSHNALVHARTLPMEVAGHEFWGGDGKTIWYDWQYPKDKAVYVAANNPGTAAFRAYAVEWEAQSVHYNASVDGELLVGDGRARRPDKNAVSRQWLTLLRPHAPQANTAPVAAGYPAAGSFDAEKLVNMGAHNYAIEPNARFSPDRKLVIFRSNMFGQEHVFAVEVAKSQGGAGDSVSTPDLVNRYRLAQETP